MKIGNLPIQFGFDYGAMAMRKCEYEAIAWQYLTGQYINVIASHTP